MRILLLLTLVMLASCSWIGTQANNFMNWGNCHMPTYSGERKDCKDEAADQAKNSARPPAGNMGTMGASQQPWPYNGTPGIMPPSVHAGQSTSGEPPNSGAGQADKADEDFPAEYRNAKPGRDSNFDTMIPPPPM